MKMIRCGGCNEPILDRYLLNIGPDQSWHPRCVTCFECKELLTEKCFSRDGKLFCRKDFFTIFGTKCAGCSQGILPTDMVRRARSKVFHVHCFTCLMCRKQLATGEELYILDDSRYICKEDFFNSRHHLMHHQQQQQQQSHRLLQHPGRGDHELLRSLSRASEETAAVVTPAAAAADTLVMMMGPTSGESEGEEGRHSRCPVTHGTDGRSGSFFSTSGGTTSSDFSPSLSAASPTATAGGHNNNILISNNNNNSTSPAAFATTTTTSAPLPCNKKFLRKSSASATGKKRGRGRARKNVLMEQELQLLRSGMTAISSSQHQQSQPLPMTPMDESLVPGSTTMAMVSECHGDESGIHCGPGGGGGIYSDFNSFSNLSSSSGSFAGSSVSMGKKYPGPGSPSQMGSSGQTTGVCGSSGGTSGNGRTKRMRTSFKHHQLKKMKSYFTMNHNPDSKALKELSIETGLSKRVLQVWFQNARAKWRRSVLRQQSAVGPDVVKEPTPLSELSDLSSSTKNQLEEIHEDTEISQSGSADLHSPACDSATTAGAATGADLQRNIGSENWENPFSHLNSHPLHHHSHHHPHHHPPHHHLHHQLKGEEESASSFQSIHEELNHSIFNLYRPLQLY